mgnify:FL=1
MTLPPTKLSGTFLRSGSVPPVVLGGGVVSSSGQVTNLIPTGTVSSSAQIDYNSITNKLSGVYSSSTQAVAAIAGQTIAPSVINATGAISGASIQTSGNGTVGGNLTVTGTITATSQSIQYVSSSQFNVATNKIIVNTNQSLQFGGLSVIDSGSATNSGSLYWDSVNNRWLYENVSGGSYNSAILINGPINTGATGTERGLLTGRIPVASGDDHIDTAAASSSIRVDFPSKLTHVEAGLFVTGALTANGTILLAGILSSSGQFNALTGTSASYAATSSNLNGGTANYIPLWSSATAQSASSMYQLTGNIGINNTVPSASLHISGSTMIQQVVEKIAFTGSAPIATTNIDITSGSIHYRSGSTSTNWTLNFRGDASTTLNSIMYPNQSLTVAVVVNHGATPYSASAHQIDGKAVTPRWQGSLVPTASANTTDFYSYTIFKLASASYDVFASQVKFS